MKKLMIVAAVAAITAGAFAVPCQDPQNADCLTVFTTKFSGKTALNGALDYKAVQKFAAKGKLEIGSDAAAKQVLSSLKIGKLAYGSSDLEALPTTLSKWTYFGKKLAEIEAGNYKPGKTYTLESDLYLNVENADLVAGEIAALNLWQVAFGKVKLYITKAKDNGCGDPDKACEKVLTPVSFSGWFVGDYDPGCADEAVYENCCADMGNEVVAIVGGTWVAKYNKNASKTKKCD